MPNQKRQEKVVDNTSIKTTGKQKKDGLANVKLSLLKRHSEPPVAEKIIIIPEEKVEVLIKEMIRINPRDFSAFKHALEEFVASWDK